MKKVGTKAPGIKLPDKENKIHQLPRSEAVATVVYFYPKDSTPGCTIEAQEFNRDLKRFEALGVDVVGISGGDAKSKSKFCTAHKLKLLLLSDADFNVAKKFGVYGEKKFMGRTFNGIKRTTFIINRQQRIVAVFENVKAAGHSAEILEYLKAASITANGC